MYHNDNWPEGQRETQYPGGEKIRQHSFLRPNFWKIIALGSLVLVVIFAVMSVALLMNHPQPSPSRTTAIIPPPTQQQATPQMTPTGSVNTTPTATTATNTPTPVLQSGLPCTVNMATWTNGSADWKVLNGMALNDGTNGNATSNNGPTLVAPCQIGTATNYAVESKIQVISTQGSSSFGITVRGNPVSDGWQGYRAGIGDGSSFGTVRLSGENYYDTTQGESASFDPGTSAHLYRVEAKDNTIKLFIDGNLILTMTDNRYLTGSEVGLWSNDVQLQVSSFKVMAM